MAQPTMIGRCCFFQVASGPAGALAFEHIQKRHQEGDDGLTLEYLKELQEYYSRMVSRVPCKMLVINGNRDPCVIHKQILEYLSTAGNVRQKAVSPKECTNMCSVS